MRDGWGEAAYVVLGTIAISHDCCGPLVSSKVDIEWGSLNLLRRALWALEKGVGEGNRVMGEGTARLDTNILWCYLCICGLQFSPSPALVYIYS